MGTRPSGSIRTRNPTSTQGTSTFLLTDGTVIAPGLAWASEPGLGLYRVAAGRIGVASGGVGVSDIATPADTNFSLYPKTAGASSQLLLYNQPSASIANANIFSIWVQPSGYVFREVLSGTATAKPLTMNFPGGFFVNGSNIVQDIGGVVTNYIQLQKPDVSGEATLAFWNKGTGTIIGRWICGTGGTMAYQQFDAAGALTAQPITVNYTTGDVTFDHAATANNGFIYGAAAGLFGITSTGSAPEGPYNRVSLLNGSND